MKKIKNEVCRYDNRLNNLSLPNISESELNLFFNLIHKMRHKQQGEIVRFEASEISMMVSNYKQAHHQRLADTTRQLFDKLFKADYKMLLKDGECVIERRFNLFKMMEIKYIVKYKEIDYIELELNEHFEYIMGNLLKDYTEFDLCEFMAISGVYTKLIYTHLKQFRTTGEWLVRWDEFLNIVKPPKTYKSCDIDNRILKPTIKELTAEHNLFNQQKTPFKNLKYQKLTKDGEPNRKKLTPYWIKFTFSPQLTTKTLRNTLLNSRFVYNNRIYNVDSIKKSNGKLCVRCSTFDAETIKIIYQTLRFIDYEHAERIINQYKFIPNA